jgi:hypothetical protein
MVTEAHLVKNMSVPILLGKDFQVKYELAIFRNAETGTRVSVPRAAEDVDAEGVDRDYRIPRVKTSVAGQPSFVRAKTTHRVHAQRRDLAKAEDVRKRTVRVTKDTKIQPGICTYVAVECAAFDHDRDGEWILERSLLADRDESFFVTPNTLLSKEFRKVPVMNNSHHPKVVRKGESLGVLQSCNRFFDKPRSEDELAEMSKKAEGYRAVIEAMAAASEEVRDHSPDDNLSREVPLQEDVVEDEPAADVGEGPKTAATDEVEIIPSAKLRELIDVGDIPDNLRDQAWAMLEQNIDAFGFDERLGQHPAQARIRLKEGVEPISLPNYGTSPQKKQVIDEQVDKWFKAGVIEPSKSPWGAPVVIAYRNGKARLCIDYRKLNAATIADEFPIPRQSEILSSLSGAQVLSSLDALAGFTQLEMHPDDVEKTAFRTHRGLFQFRQMPFGLQNGPSIFQRIMQNVLSPYLWLFCLVYIDDVVVYSTTYEEHIKHLNKVLTAIREAGIPLSPKKCHLFYSSILLLGHKVSRLGLSTHEEKVKAILELSRPTKVSELQTFLGMVVYFSAFIPFYADIAAPLFQLLRKDSRWVWGAEQETAFLAAKYALKEAPVRGHPMQGRPYRLYTDASKLALGCALQQVQPIQVKDLKNTQTYLKLEKAYEAGKPVPRLVTSLHAKTKDTEYEDTLADNRRESHSLLLSDLHGH